jgi:hypothetical protein
VNAVRAATGTTVGSTATTASEAGITEPVGALSFRADRRVQPGTIGTLFHLVRGEDWRAFALFVEEATLGRCVASVRTKIQLVVLLTTSSDLGASRIATAVDMDDVVFFAVEVIILEMGDIAVRNAALSER